MLLAREVSFDLEVHSSLCTTPRLPNRTHWAFSTLPIRSEHYLSQGCGKLHISNIFTQTTPRSQRKRDKCSLRQLERLLALVVRQPSFRDKLVGIWEVGRIALNGVAASCNIHPLWKDVPSYRLLHPHLPPQRGGYWRRKP